MKYANGQRLTPSQLLEARRARARGKRAKSKEFKGNPYDYNTETHKHQAWAQGYTSK